MRSWGPMDLRTSLSPLQKDMSLTNIKMSSTSDEAAHSISLHSHFSLHAHSDERTRTKTALPSVAMGEHREQIFQALGFGRVKLSL